MRWGTIGDGLSGPSIRVDEREREDLEREAKVCRLVGDIVDWRGVVAGREGHGDGGGPIEEEVAL